MKRKKEKCLKFTTREIKNVHVSFLTTRDLYWYGNGYCKNSLRITKTFRYWKKIPIHYILKWTIIACNKVVKWTFNQRCKMMCKTRYVYSWIIERSEPKLQFTTKKAILHDDDFLQTLTMFVFVHERHAIDTYENPF